MIKTKNTIIDTNFNFPKQKSVYKGKVREVYNINNDLLVMIATDRLSAFDVVMPKGIPYKGQILNQIATQFMAQTEDLVPNWLLATPDPNVAVGHLCEPFKVEMVIRGYLSGHAAREYKAGKRILCGVAMPEGLKENDKFPQPIITPATKAEMGAHDEDISREDILKRGIVSEADYLVLEDYTRKLFQRGTEIAQSRGLILVDTKYEFGKTKEGKIVLIDEIHTPDSSRYFYADGYEERQDKGDAQKQLSKEFVRQWLISNNFQGLEGQTVPEMSDAYIETVSERYIELYENIMGEPFVKADVSAIQTRIENNVLEFLNKHY
ncbi:phosphoribosylaminoimidazole-succinocarboxamide synthase [Flavobacteriaceae bacterium MAR_2010_105]|nr:phosphoribosylaminoimidazole-succinocarboxamide synthase [Flavobacteriaceae bacterium MAR_2010_105]